MNQARTESISVDQFYGKVISRSEATLADGSTHKIIGIEYPVNGKPSIEFVKAERVSLSAYSASVEVDDPGGAETVEDAACALIDWLRDEGGPIYVDVQTDRGKGPTYHVAVTIEDGKAVGVITDEPPSKKLGTISGVRR